MVPAPSNRPALPSPCERICRRTEGSRTGVLLPVHLPLNLFGSAVKVTSADRITWLGTHIVLGHEAANFAPADSGPLAGYPLRCISRCSEVELLFLVAGDPAGIHYHAIRTGCRNQREIVLYQFVSLESLRRSPCRWPTQVKG